MHSAPVSTASMASSLRTPKTRAVIPSAIGVKTNELAPAIDLLERVEARLGLDTTAGFSARVEAIQAGIGEHDRRRSGLEGAIAKKEEVDGKLKAATEKRDEARAWKEGWDRSWPGAMKALGGSAAASPADGNKLAGEWREARGILRTTAEIRTRLKRMDEEEAKLLEGVLRTARKLDTDVAEDGVAGARMLQMRWTENDRLRTKRDELKEEHEVRKVEAEIATETVKVAISAHPLVLELERRRKSARTLETEGGGKRQHERRLNNVCESMPA
jgi:hypothetical protein